MKPARTLERSASPTGTSTTARQPGGHGARQRHAVAIEERQKSVTTVGLRSAAGVMISSSAPASSGEQPAEHGAAGVEERQRRDQHVAGAHVTEQRTTHGGQQLAAVGEGHQLGVAGGAAGVEVRRHLVVPARLAEQPVGGLVGQQRGQVGSAVSRGKRPAG